MSKLHSSFEDKTEEETKVVPILYQLQSVFNCFTVAMRFEPANAKYFQVEIASGNSLLEAIHFIGCFSSQMEHKVVAKDMPESSTEESSMDIFKQSFSSDISALMAHRNHVKSQHPELHPRLFYASVVLKMLHDMAVDGYEKSSTSSLSVSARYYFLELVLS